MPVKTSRFCTLRIAISLLSLTTTPALLSAQIGSAKELMAQMLEHQQKIRQMEYTIQMLDTFTTGAIRVSSGTCRLMKNEADSLFGYSFYGKRHDVAQVLVYTGGKAFQLKQDLKTFSVDLRPQIHILGQAGGQVVLTDLLQLDTAGAVASRMQETDSCYLLRIDYPDNTEYQVSDRYKLLFVDKKSLLPFRCYSHLQSLGKHQGIMRRLTSLSVNEAIRSPFDFTGNRFIEGYTMEENTNSEPSFLKLLQKPAPPLDLGDLSGRQFRTSDLTGKAILLDFWEVWCAPCIASLPNVEALHQQYKDQGLVVTGILCDTADLTAARKLIATKNLSFSHLVGNASIRKQYKVEGVPQYVLIDRTGIVTFIQNGFNEAKLKAAILKALE